MEDFINYLHELFLPVCGPWLEDVIPLLGYVNSIANVIYLYFGFRYTKTPRLADIFGTGVWLPVLIIVCLSGVYYKNAHQTISFFIALVFLLTHLILLVVRYKKRKKAIKHRTKKQKKK